MPGYCIGSSISENQTWFGILERSGKPLAIWSVPTLKRRGCRIVLSDMVSEIQSKLAEFRISLRDIAGIGVSVPAEVGRTGILDYCEELGWGIVNIEDLLNELSGLKVRAGSSRDMAVLGEHWVLGKNAPENMVSFLVENELRGGIIVNNRLITDRNGKSGDLSKILAVGPDAAADSRNRIMLREISSYRSMLERYRSCAEYMEKTASVQNVHMVSGHDMQRAARAGDPLCNKILDASASAIAAALYNIGCTVCIEKAVIGGGEELGRALMAEKVARFYRNLPDTSSTGLVIEPSKLGKTAEVYGSAKYLLMNDMVSSADSRGREQLKI